MIPSETFGPEQASKAGEPNSLIQPCPTVFVTGHTATHTMLRAETPVGSISLFLEDDGVDSLCEALQDAKRQKNSGIIVPTLVPPKDIHSNGGGS